jgi:phage FluMu protein Com
MERTVRCTRCECMIKIAGPTDGGREIFQPVTCPFCEALNEIRWPIGSGHTVGRYFEGEILK